MDFVVGGMSDDRAYCGDLIEIFIHISDEP